MLINNVYNVRYGRSLLSGVADTLYMPLLTFILISFTAFLKLLLSPESPFTIFTMRSFVYLCFIAAGVSASNFGQEQKPLTDMNTHEAAPTVPVASAQAICDPDNNYGLFHGSMDLQNFALSPLEIHTFVNLTIGECCHWCHDAEEGCAAWSFGGSLSAGREVGGCSMALYRDGCPGVEHHVDTVSSRYELAQGWDRKELTRREGRAQTWKSAIGWTGRVQCAGLIILNRFDLRLD